jgi:KaiC/GvpD/RAD55 family RecA-like ATPase
MNRIPFGVSQLDQRIGGGAPPGSVVLLAGEAGAGAREFCYTSAVMNGLGTADRELFDLHYGDLYRGASLPEEVHYLSLTASGEEIRSEMGYAMDEEIVDAGAAAVTFADLSPEYFQMSPVPRAWYESGHASLVDLGEETEREDALAALASYVETNAAGNLLILDSLTDLVSARREGDRDWSDVVYLLKGLRKAVRAWQGAILLHLSLDAISETRLGDLMASVDGTMAFQWAAGGNELARTLVVREFRGVLSQLEEEEIARFETEIHEAGYDITNVRKVR